MPPLEAWEKVLVSADFVKTTHGKLACIDCHGGAQSAEKEAAHKGMTARPYTTGKGQCSTCHSAVSSGFSTSLHATQAGYWTVMNARSTPDKKPALEKMFGNHCANCHTTCGECHISQPRSVGSGFLNGHNFEKTPSMTRNCTACHGSRVGNEYLGKNEELPGDVHFRNSRMTCISCHKAADLHATPADSQSHRYAGPQQPACITCHAKVGFAGDAIAQHTVHQNKVQCQVCHSISYTSCDGCHVQVSKETNKPFFKTDAHYLGFWIGKNPRKDANRPYEYVTLRHVPVDKDNYAFYGENLMPNYDKLPTWTFATPHNIQRKTPQTATCNNCHGNKALFLTLDKVAKEEVTANKAVIVEKIPVPIGGQ